VSQNVSGSEELGGCGTVFLAAIPPAWRIMPRPDRIPEGGLVRVLLLEWMETNGDLEVDSFR